MRGNKKQNLRVVVRRLPPTLPCKVFESTVAQWRQSMRELTFVPGSSGNNIVSFEYARAYITFVNLASLLNFTNAYNGWRFESSDGKTYMALVEFAPSQKYISVDKKVDPIAGQYVSDAQYLDFIMNVSKPPTVPDSSANEPSSLAKQDPSMTPLLLYLAERKEKKKLKKTSKPGKILKKPQPQPEVRPSTTANASKPGKKKRKQKKSAA